MITVDAATTARLATVAGVCYLIELDFTGGTLRYTTYGQSIVATTSVSATFEGLGTALALSQIKESEDAGADKLTLSLSLGNTAVLAAALGNVETYRGRRMRVYLQLLDENHLTVGMPVLRYSGFMDPAQVNVEVDSQTGQRSGRVDLPCSRAGMARARNYQGLRLSDEQQRARFATDRGFEYIRKLIEAPPPWLTIKFMWKQ